MNEPIRRNFLSLEQQFAVGNYLTLNKEAILKDRPTLKDLADTVTKELGFTVTAVNVRSVADACKVTWEPKSTQGRGGMVGFIRDTKERIETLEAQVRKLHVTVEQLEGECQRLRVGMTALFDGLGSTPPAAAGIPPKNSRGVTVNNK